MDVLGTARAYIKEMVNLAGPQMKVILMDKETTTIVSCAFAQSEMMQKEVYLFERLDSPIPREPIKHLKCLVFIRPTANNIQLLSTELRNPRYAQYYIYFSNIVSKTDLKTLAEADEQETVREVHEFFVDGIALSSALFCINLKDIYDHSFILNTSALLRIKQALVALLLNQKKKPILRFQRSSENCKRLADEVNQVIKREEGLFDNSKRDTMLLIIDRSEDPVTPLLNQWTYEAMVHELITINNNRVSIDGQSMVLSELHDEFYAKNVSSNFGEIGQNIKLLMNEFQQKAQIHKNLESIADMKNFVEEYPQFKKISGFLMFNKGGHILQALLIHKRYLGTVSKHVTLVGELSKIVANQNLLEISEVEQSIVAEGDHSRCLERVRILINHPKTSRLNALRLLLLYALRFEANPNNDITGLINLLKKNVDAGSIVRALLRYAGSARRNNDLFGEGSTMEMTKRFIKGLKGVENIYTQHQPYIKNLIENVIRGKLSEQQYPFVSGDFTSNRQDNLIIFILGGATFEESLFIRSQNEKRMQGGGGPAVLLATTFMHNTTSFVEQFSETAFCSR
ncbi:Sec1 family protein [Dictyocaulus viviparus]|uniref:Sec1 family protein n=1 Tax=Dictyocaulus viviparus TaxID=29172 RepID=A0A0D8YCW8_DICVI|nr:Sec1 family protein [Dictyocaulus viviparus]